MKTWIGSLSCSNRFKLIFLCLSLIFLAGPVNAQPDVSEQPITIRSFLPERDYSYIEYADKQSSGMMEEDQSGANFPKPKSVLFKSLMVPGWGQIVNDQIWKVPIIYGLLGGLTGYSIYLTKRYHDYRAAFYNLNNDDLKFGPTPDFIPDDASADQLRSVRDQLRNRRDFIYVTIFLAYGLNAVDAYVFAHMKSFDVSEDLSMKTTLKPTIMEGTSPGVSLSVELFNRKKTR